MCIILIVSLNSNKRRSRCVIYFSLEYIYSKSSYFHFTLKLLFYEIKFQIIILFFKIVHTSLSYILLKDILKEQLLTMKEQKFLNYSLFARVFSISVIIYINSHIFFGHLITLNISNILSYLLGMYVLIIRENFIYFMKDI